MTAGMEPIALPAVLMALAALVKAIAVVVRAARS